MISLFKKIFKIILSCVPLTIATWVYTKIINKTLLRHIVNNFIKSGIPKELQIEEGKMILNQDDVAVSGMLALNSFEPYQTSLFRKELKEGMTVVDIGANIGYYSVIAGRRVGQNGKVFSFEPEPNNFSFLVKNIEVNNLKNVTASQVALSNKLGTENLFLFAENTGSYSLVDNRGTATSISVKTDRLDNIIKVPVDIIKMDIEGAEYLALEGMKKLINRSPKLILMTEFFPNAIRRFGKDPLDFLKMLMNFGFDLSEINEDKKILLPILNIEEYMQKFPRGEIATNIYARRG